MKYSNFNKGSLNKSFIKYDFDYICVYIYPYTSTQTDKQGISVSVIYIFIYICVVKYSCFNKGNLNKNFIKILI